MDTIMEGNRKKMSEHLHQFEELHVDLLQAIAEKLTHNIDYIRFRAVSLSCRSALPVKPSHNLPRQLPWLMIPNYPYEENVCSYFSLSNNKTHKLKLPEPYKKLQHYSGSSNGWLVMANIGIDSFELSLLNPLTKDKFQLPPLFLEDHRNIQWLKCFLHIYHSCSLNSYHMKRLSEYATGFLRMTFLHKVVFSTIPSMNNEYVAVAICNRDSTLALLRSEDKKWTEIQLHDPIEIDLTYIRYDDILYHKGRFYVVDDRGRLMVCNVDISSSQLSPRTTIIASFEEEPAIYGPKYLVELSEELLLVIKDRDKGFFYVFKFNQSEGNWLKVNSLGDHMLFLGYENSLSFSARDFPECKANCIYYINEDYAYWKSTSRLAVTGASTVGVYNLEDDSVEQLPCYPHNWDVDGKIPTWITPSLC